MAIKYGDLNKSQYGVAGTASYLKYEDLVEQDEKDNINPSHYLDTYPFEVIELIKKALTYDQFIGFCLGNEIKYRMRAGVKNSKTLEEDILKAEWYRKARNSED